MQTSPRSFTIESHGKFRDLVTTCGIAAAFNPNSSSRGDVKTFEAIWDTGATGTVITQKVVDDIGLKPIGMTKVHTVNGTYDAENYLINIELPNHVGFCFVRVTKTESLGGDKDALIGMDIISEGDFAVTNFGGKSIFTFRVPSSGHIDFSAVSKPGINAKQGRNSPCPCGSQQKFKNCCGR